jgi:hypothetical protein
VKTCSASFNAVIIIYFEGRKIIQQFLEGWGEIEEFLFSH